MIFLENESMSKHTSFRVGGPAKYFAEINLKSDLPLALEFVKEKNLPFFLLGNGTNILVSDKGFNGVVLQLGSGFSAITDNGTGCLTVGASVPLGRLSRTSVKKGLFGIHKLCGIPGSVGGAIYMNAGAYGQEISKHCKSVTSISLDGKEHVRYGEQCCFSYRHSYFQDLVKEGVPEIIVSADFDLPPIDSFSEQSQMEAEMRELAKKRAESQPLTMPNAGSTFKRLQTGTADMPQQVAPGYYIEQAGLKGYRIGGAEVSTVHANFIVNAGDATAADIKNLSEHVQKTVAEKFGLQLQREIILLGEF